MRRFAVSWLMLVLWVGGAAAQENAVVVSGVGTESVQVLPDELRMTVALRAQQGTLEQALTVYRARKEAVTKLLKEAGALPESVKVSDPKLEEPPSGQAAALRRALERARPQPAKAEAGSAAKAIAFTAEATWKLSATSADELLLAAATVEDKVRKLDLLGKASMTPEELETLEESAGAQEEFTYEPTKAQPGEPSFLYAKKLDGAQLTALKKAAYEKAVASARELAAIAGRELGDLASLSAMAAPPNLEEANYYESAALRRLFAAAGRFGPGGMESGKLDEALGAGAGKVSLEVHVMVGFRLK